VLYFAEMVLYCGIIKKHIKMRDLKEFYETKIRKGHNSMPAFENADKETLESIKKSISFACWKTSRACEKLKEALLNFGKQKNNLNN